MHKKRFIKSGTNIYKCMHLQIWTKRDWKELELFVMCKINYYLNSKEREEHFFFIDEEILTFTLKQK